VTPEQLALERQAFEAWADGRPGARLRSSEHGFDYPLGRLLWQAWLARAAKDAALAPLPVVYEPRWVDDLARSQNARRHL